MSHSLDSNMITIYFKLAFTEITHTQLFQNSLTIKELLEYVNSILRIIFDINRKYNIIELVETGQQFQELADPIDTMNNETVIQRFRAVNDYISFYVRPTIIIREFIRQEDYSV